MIKCWMFLFLSVFISSISQILLKKSANLKYSSIIKEYLNKYVIGGYGLFFIATILVILAYTKLDYKNGAIIESLGFILVMIWSKLFLKEKIGKKRIIGNLIIVIGVIVFYL